MTFVISLVSAVLRRAERSADVVLAVVLAAIIGAMVVPLPEWALDVGLAINLVAALALLVAALSAKDALQVAAFPTLLLVTTLFRLAMNVSSTRLALAEGHAGDIIQAFGDFVVRGDYVVGTVIFAILTLVQFLVVAKGAERVAEVSARFTLDAMPGKQMSIDADLRAGAITQDAARQRRRELERESQLFGAMDGAMKFVKGDVIAGLIITIINLVGGTAIGVLQGGMTAGEAASTYALIAIGDGLVSQLPSLCIAIAAGLVVTRVASDSAVSSLGRDIGSQFFGHWRALLVVAALSLGLGLMPGMPHLTFLIVSLLLGALAMSLRARVQTPATHEPGAPLTTPTPGTQPEGAAEASSGVSPLILDLAADLGPLTRDGATFVEQTLASVRERVFAELGVRIPGIRVRVGAPLAAGGYSLSIDEVPAVSGVLTLERLYAAVPASDLRVLGVDVEATRTIGHRAFCVVPLSAGRRLGLAGIPFRTAPEVIADHLAQALVHRSAAFLGVQEVHALLEATERTSPTLCKEALTKVPLPLLTDVLRRLLREQVSVRNLKQILECLVSPSSEGDAGQLAEACRAALHRQLSHQHAPGGPLRAWLVDPVLEDRLRHAGPTLALEPTQANAIYEGVRRIAAQGRGVLLSAPDVRRALRRLIEGPFPEVAVLTYTELDRDLQIQPLGRLTAS